MQDFPFVSIIVAAYDSEKTIDKCIEALYALDYPKYEIVIVDNISQDKTAEIVKKYDVTYIREKKKGWPAARNTRIAYSKARYVANIDADCFASPKWLSNLMTAFNDENIGCIVGKTLVEQGKTLAQRYYASSDPFGIEHKIGKTDFVPWGGGNNAMVREAFFKAGGYDSDRFTSGADMEFHIRLEKEFGHKTIYAPEAIIYHEARGSLREFFTVASKYAHDGFLRSRTEEMKNTQNCYRFFIVRKFYHMTLHLLGMGYRCVKALFGKDTWFRVASNFFSIVNLSGTIYGYLKGRMKYIWHLKTIEGSKNAKGQRCNTGI